MKNQHIEPTIVTDSREQRPLTFTRFRSERGTLTSGDYSMRGFESVFAVERKSVDDLVGSLTAGRDRFTKELQRLRGYQFRRLLIEGDRATVEAGAYRSKATPQSILGSLAALEVRYNIPVVWAGDRDTAAGLIEQWAFYYLGERVKQAQQIMAMTTPPETAGDAQQTAAAATTPRRPSDAVQGRYSAITAKAAKGKDTAQ